MTNKNKDLDKKIEILEAFPMMDYLGWSKYAKDLWMELKHGELPEYKHKKVLALYNEVLQGIKKEWGVKILK